MHLIVFQIEKQLMALALSEVDRVIMASEITPFASAPDHVMGVINMHGEIVPVINLRKILEFPEKELDITDQFLMTQVEGHRVALWIDHVTKVEDFIDQELISKDQLFWAFKDQDKIVFVYNLAQLLPIETLKLFTKAS